MTTPVILSCGNGNRLWPFLRESSPGQFDNASDERSLLQKTLFRLADLPAAGEAVIVCNEDHRFDVACQLEDIKADVGAVCLANW